MKILKIKNVSRGGWSSLEWNYRGDWLSSDFISEKDFEKITKLISKIQDKAPEMKKGTNVLIDKNSDVPRPKLKEFIADNGLKKVTLLSKANVVAVRRETIKFLQGLQIETKLELSADDKDRIIGERGIDKAVLRAQNNEGAMDQEYFDVKNRCSDLTGVFMNGYRSKKQQEQIDFVMSLLNSKATLVYDDALLNEINSDGLDLDDDIYETLEGMLKSRDNETFNLGIEMLSNVNLENNLFKISVLLNDVFNNTYRLNALSSIRNRNFKSLLSYVESQGIRWNQSWETFGMSMLVKFQNTEYKQNIKDYLVKNTNDRFKKVCGGDVLQVVNIVYEGGI